MRFFAITILLVMFGLSVFSQEVKPKPSSSKPKSSVSKPKSTTAKPKTSAAKPKATTNNPKTTAAKPKPLAAPAKKLDEKSEWTKAAAVADKVERIAALRKFAKAFPQSERLAEASALIAAAEAALGNEKLEAGDVPGAGALFTAAAKDAPKPISDQLFTDTLSKFSANLYFRGMRDAAFEIAKILENKAETNAAQLLSIAAFYMSVENGAEAKRLAESAIRLEPNSAAAYQTLALASRIEFQLDESAAAYAKALELEPESPNARRGLAEMKRSLGKSDEAVALYREILAKDAGNLPAETGLILSLFEAGKRGEAEADLAKSLEANPGNVILLAGAAYWHAVHNENDKAIDFATKAVVADPRFIWSHIALARGHLGRNDPVAAEKTLLAARRYGNFPMLEYELASARLAAGYYREAAEGLAKVFSVTGGTLKTNLGGRVARESKNFTELVGFERRASIFAPTAADSPENAARLMALLELQQETSSPEPNADAAARAADAFIKGDDKMKVHRQIFAAEQLLDKRLGNAKIIEIAKAATANVDQGLDVPHAAIAVMASELYENRAVADARGQYVNVPNVPKSTLSAILRGRVEQLSGWAAYQLNDPAEATLRLRRAVGIFPADSAWWRSSTWRLGAALALAGKDAEALDMYVKSYRSSAPDVIRYGVIERLYRQVNGNTDGLEARIGANPAPAATDTVARKTEPTPTPELKSEATTGSFKDLPTSGVMPALVPVATPRPEAPPDATPAIVPVATPVPETTPEATPSPAPTAFPAAESTPELTPPPSPSPTVIAEATPATLETLGKEIKENTGEIKPGVRKTDLFPPVVITIPQAVKQPATNKTPRVEPSPIIAPEFKPCTLNVSEETITLKTGGGDLAVIVGTDFDGDLDDLAAISTSPKEVSVRREPIAGVKGRALYVLRSISDKTGVYQVRFEMPCGKTEIVVKVR